MAIKHFTIPHCLTNVSYQCLAIAKYRLTHFITCKTWSFSSACKNLGAQHPLGVEIYPFEKIDLGE